MAREEIIEKRTSRSKTYRNEDGSFTFISGGEIAHHQENGQWVDTECELEGDIEMSPKRHPHDIRIPKVFSQPLQIDDIIIRPLDFAKPAVQGVKEDNKVVYENAWNGINVERIIVPEGIIERISIINEEGQKIISWSIEGRDSLIAEFRPPGYLGEDEEFYPVPVEFIDGILSYNLINIPIGAVIE